MKNLSLLVLTFLVVNAFQSTTSAAPKKYAAFIPLPAGGLLYSTGGEFLFNAGLRMPLLSASRPYKVPNLIFDLDIGTANTVTSSAGILLTTALGGERYRGNLRVALNLKAAYMVRNLNDMDTDTHQTHYRGQIIELVFSPFFKFGFGRFEQTNSLPFREKETVRRAYFGLGF
ncbi:MAG: hypothetical protein OEX00_06545 [Gammaproteobacteria bacterium]|nr:hypothetical protein [Gammaproteobacteria bacterium]MDH5692448.1 hypothetical protein [Gammaproteobacteria bacterium]